MTDKKQTLQQWFRSMLSEFEDDPEFQKEYEELKKDWNKDLKKENE